ncbi:MAG: hypothetical protein ACTSUI_04195, partial [Promethearchaeota archaeon]
MELFTAINRIFEIYSKISSAQNIKPGFGRIYREYKTKTGDGLLLIIIGPPTKRIHGKKKDFEKILQKTANSNRLILPKEYFTMHNYASQAFPTLITPRNKILEFLIFLLSCLRLEFVPIQNMRYVFKNMKDVKIMVYETVIQNQYACYINIIDLKEEGLYLAHENQLQFIKSEVLKGINPNNIRNLPALRTGSTEINKFAKKKKIRKSTNASVEKFRKKIQQKKMQEQINSELEFETVIDFSPDKNMLNKDQKDKESGPVDIFGKPLPKIRKKKIIQDKNEIQNSISLNQKEKAHSLQESNLKPIGMDIKKKSNSIPKPAPMPLNNKDNPQKNISSNKTTPENFLNATVEKKAISLKIEDLKKQISHMEDLQQENEDLKDQLKLVTNNLSTQLESKDKRIKSLETEAVHYKATIQNLENNTDKELQIQIADLKQQLESYERIIKTLEAERSQIKTSQNLSSKSSTSTTSPLIPTQKKEIEKIRSQISHLEKQLNELNTENNMLKANTTYLEQKIQKYLKNLK